MSRPTDAPEWASDAAYPAGAEDWSATDTKIEPTAGEKGTGATPLTGLGAQQFNWVLGNLSDWVNYLDETLLGGPAAAGNAEIMYLLAADMQGWTYTNAAGVISAVAGSSGLILQAPLALPGRSATVYQQVKSVSIYMNKADGANLTARLKNVQIAGDTGTDIATAASSATGAVTITITADGGIKTATNEALAVYITSVAAGDKVFGMKVTYDNELYL